MIENYYPFKRYSLFKATVLALLLPGGITSLAGITTLLLYGYSVPATWLCLMWLPLILIAYKVSIEQSGDTLLITRSLFRLPIKSTKYVLNGQAVRWDESPQKQGLFMLKIGEKDTGLRVDTV